MVGLTATPERSDGDWVPSAIGPISVAITTADLIYQGYLCDLRCQAMAGYADEEMLVTLFTELIQGGRQVIGFCASAYESYRVAAALQGRGLWATNLIGKTKAGQQDEILSEFRSGKLRAILSHSLLTEGYDLPVADTAVIARRINSPLVMSQMIGRILRPGRKAGKCAWTYDYPDMEGVWPTNGLLGSEWPWLTSGLNADRSAREVINERWSDETVRQRDFAEVVPYFEAKYAGF